MKHDVHLPNFEDQDKLAFLIFNVFTPDECQQWIGLSEQRGYSTATVNVGGGMSQLMTDFRNSDRLGLNERLRFLRYDPGQYFEPHMDGEFHRNDGSNEQSFITIQLYLNEGYKGGATTFVHYSDCTRNVPCVPRTG
ncbi:unnamed protein product, partial [Rotaria sp. Silwood1]